MTPRVPRRLRRAGHLPALRRHAALIQESELFNAAYYRSQLPPDSVPPGREAAHYLALGWRRGLDPHPLFASMWYLGVHPDAHASGLEPLTHYLTRGYREGKSPHPLFDVGYYLWQSPHLRPGVHDPLTDFLRAGWPSKRDPHPLVDLRYIEQQLPRRDSRVDPLTDALQQERHSAITPHRLLDMRLDAFVRLERRRHREAMGAEPFPDDVGGDSSSELRISAAFDPYHYRSQCGDLSMSDRDALVHFSTVGWREGRNPNPLFDCTEYLRQNPERFGEQRNPLISYLVDGERAGISPHYFFDASFVRRQAPAESAETERAGRTLLEYFLGTGEREGIWPNRWFDPSWYRSRHGEIPEEVSSCSHYLSIGWPQAFDPSSILSVQRMRDLHPECVGVEPIRFILQTGTTPDMKSAGAYAPVSTDPALERRLRKETTIIGPHLDLAGRQVAIIAASDQRRRIGVAVEHMARALVDHGFAVVVSFSHGIDPEQANEFAQRCQVQVLSRTHQERDYGSWLTALTMLEIAEQATELLLINDSVIGPIGDLSRFLSRIRSLDVDVAAAVESASPFPHLQSWLLLLSRRAVATQFLDGLLAAAGAASDKYGLIEIVELTVARRARQFGLTSGALLTPSALGDPHQNPATSGWHDLLRYEIPFAKREIFTLPRGFYPECGPFVIDTLCGLAGPNVSLLVDDSLAQIGHEASGRALGQASSYADRSADHGTRSAENELGEEEDVTPASSCHGEA